LNSLGSSLSGIRLASLCGSIKPHFSGTEDYHAALLGALGGLGLDTEVVDRADWTMPHLPGLLRAVRDARPDAILLQYPTDAFARSLSIHAFALLQRTAPLIVTLHEFSAAHPLRRLSLLGLLARAAAVVTTTSGEADRLCAWYPWLRPRVQVIPIGANTPARVWRPSVPREVVYFGQIRPEKGLEEFIAVQARLAASGSDASFTIIGSCVPLFASYFDRIVGAARDRNIEIVTGLSSDAVADRLSRATLALLPYPDGASMRRSSLLAAAMCGVPIVTRTSSETPPELAALLSSASGTTEMAMLVSDHLGSPAALKAAHENSCRLAAMVSWDAIAAKYAPLIAAAAASGRVRPDDPRQVGAMPQHRPITASGAVP
jgi:glycosyltransferase involved in cell wall biosynthesis